MNYRLCQISRMCQECQRFTFELYRNMAYESFVRCREKKDDHLFHIHRLNFKIKHSMNPTAIGLMLQAADGLHFDFILIVFQCFLQFIVTFSSI